MLFNSYEFIFRFLPVVFIVFFLAASLSHFAAAGWLGLASLFFYGWSSVNAIPLLLCSVCANYWFGMKLTPLTVKLPSASNERTRQLYLYISLTANLALLGFFKYADFFITSANVGLVVIHQQPISLLHVVLPIGISFFTFTQIAFLVDCWQGKVKERNFAHYLLFVTYFPHLIAGPLLHHSQMMPQFAKTETYRINYDKIAIGIVIFTIGLAKKLLIADPLAEHADVLFKAVANGTAPTFFMSWSGIFAYAFQIYFDFSGYSDMAIGLSLFFGIHLPINFDSPYKATSIIDFWRRWHISLSTFLRDYLYIPLGGNKLGKFRRYFNLLVTMLLGGLWHGANWTFVLWGAAHGILLVINHGWRRFSGEAHQYGLIGKAISWLTTFICVCFTWVLFRADSVRTALGVYKGALGFNGFGGGNEQNRIFPYLIVALLITLMFQNTNRISYPIHQPNTSHTLQNILSLATAMGVSIIFSICLLKLDKPTAFLYYQF